MLSSRRKNRAPGLFGDLLKGPSGKAQTQREGCDGQVETLPTLEPAGPAAGTRTWNQTLQALGSHQRHTGASGAGGQAEGGVWLLRWQMKEAQVSDGRESKFRLAPCGPSKWGSPRQAGKGRAEGSTGVDTET